MRNEFDNIDRIGIIVMFFVLGMCLGLGLKQVREDIAKLAERLPKQEASK